MRKVLVLILLTILTLGVASQMQEPGIASPGNEAVQILQEYVRIPSLSGNEQEAAAYFSSICKDKGLYIHHFRDEGSYNFIASLYPLTDLKPNIVFLHHMDVVSPGDTADWAYPPFSGTLSGGEVWGRGSIDNKSLGVAHLMAVSSFAGMADTTDLPYNASLLCVCGEETGGVRGSAIIAEKYLDKINPVCVIGEGGSGLEGLDFIGREEPVFTISIADKSMLWLELTVEDGTMGHASVNSGDYAGKRLVMALQRVLSRQQPLIMTEAARMMFWHIGDITGGVKGIVLKNIDRSIFRPVLKRAMRKEARLASFLSNSITLTSLRNAVIDPNQHAPSISATLDCRLLPGFPHQKMLDWIKKRINDTVVKVRVLHQGPRGQLSAPGEIFGLLEASIGSVYGDTGVIPVLFPASSDNDYYRNKGILVYGLNPFILSFDQINSIHNVNERITVSEMIKGTKVFTAFLDHLFLSGLSVPHNLSAR